MLVPFGTHVRDKDGKSIGTVSRLVLHPESRQVVALVVRQGVLDRREIVVPIRMVERAGDEVRLTLRAAELADEVKKLEPRYVSEPGTAPVR